jgi:hypothetical protein
MRTLIVLFSILVMTAGCDSKPPQKTVFDPQVDALKKARATEQKVLDAAQRGRENVERQELGEKKE